MDDFHDPKGVWVCLPVSATLMCSLFGQKATKTMYRRASAPTRALQRCSAAV